MEKQRSHAPVMKFSPWGGNLVQFLTSGKDLFIYLALVKYCFNCVLLLFLGKNAAGFLWFCCFNVQLQKKKCI